MQNETQAEAVARIALDMGYDGPPFLPEAKEVIKALNRAYQAGWSSGYSAGLKSVITVQDAVYKAMGL